MLYGLKILIIVCVRLQICRNGELLLYGLKILIIVGVRLQIYRNRRAMSIIFAIFAFVL